MKDRQGPCILIITILTLLGNSAYSQQPTGFNQFFLNPSTLNPSYTGIDGRPAAFLGYRRQWAGLQGGPSLGYFNIQAPLPNKVALGATIGNDKRGLVNTSSLLFTAGYSAHLSEDMYFRFGFSLGGAWNKVDLNNLYFVTQGDPALSTLTSSNMEVLANVGLSFHSKTFHAGLGLPNLFERTYVSQDAFTFSTIKPLQTLVVNASNRFYFSKGKNVVEPYLIYRLNSALPSQLEVATVLHLQNRVWVGGSYRQDFGISALAGVKLNGLFALGYSYGVKNTGDNKMSFPSHEIQLALLLGKRVKHAPMYSFVNTDIEKHKKTPKELLAEKKKKEDALAKKTPPKPAPKKEEPKKDSVVAKLEPIQKKEEPVENKIVEEKPIVKTGEHLAGPRKKDIPLFTPLDSVPDHERDQHLHEQEILQRLNTHANDAAEHHTEGEQKNNERHDFVKRGDHPEEMNMADYVIVGAFRGKENAQHYDEQMVSMGFPEVHYGFLSARNLWYVYVASANDINEARAARDKYRKMKMFKDAWLLTVHE